MNAPAIENIRDRRFSEAAVIPGTQLLLGSIFSGTAEAAKLTEGITLPVRVISQLGAPRWVLPADERRAVSVLQTWAPYGVRSRVKWGAIVGACRLSALSMLPGVAREYLTCDFSYWRRMLPGYQDSWAIVGYIGNPSPTRKVLLFFLDTNGQVRAVVKVPVQPEAKAAIVDESNILKKMRDRLPVPLVLFCDEGEGIAAQSWIEGVSAPRAFGREHLELLMQLVSNRACLRLNERRQALEMRIASLRRSSDSPLLGRALSLLNSKEEVPECIEHGDFTPWNLRRISHGHLTLIDWEWSVEAGYPWQDICRYFYLQAYLFRHTASVWKRLITHPLLTEYCRRLGLSAEAMRGLTARFLLRFLCDSHDEGDADKVAFAMAKIREVLNG